jgi:hypothetical protein
MPLISANPAHSADATLSLASRIPFGLKIAYTAFMAVLVPVYWYNYGPTNFLYFCDIALFVTLIGIWRESALLISMAAVGILAPQVLWVADFVAELCGGHLTGMTAYMFNQDKPLFLRGLSLFHGWLPFLLVYLVWRLGYDRRALVCWTVLAWVLLLVCYTLMPGPRADAASIATPVNINYVHGMSDTAAQTWMPPLAWFGTMLIGLPLLIFLPTHFVLRFCCARKSPVKTVG